MSARNKTAVARFLINLALSPRETRNDSVQIVVANAVIVGKVRASDPDGPAAVVGSVLDESLPETTGKLGSEPGDALSNEAIVIYDAKVIPYGCASPALTTNMLCVFASDIIAITVGGEGPVVPRLR